MRLEDTSQDVLMHKAISRGVGYLSARVTVVTLPVFLILRMVHLISWSWLWVLSPLWIGIAFILSYLLVATLVFWLLAIGMDREIR